MDLCNKSSKLSQATFGWVYPLLQHSRESDLTIKDLGGISAEYQSSSIFSEVKTSWLNEILRCGMATREDPDFDDSKAPKPSIFVPLWHVIKKPMLKCTFCGIFVGLLPFALPLLSSGFLTWIKDMQHPLCDGDPENLLNLTLAPPPDLFCPHHWVGYVYAAAMFVALLLMTVMQSHMFAYMSHVAVAGRAALDTLIYDKSLRLGPVALAETSTGVIINLVSQDVEQMMSTSHLLTLFTYCPMQTLLAFLLLIWKMSWAVVFGGIVLVAAVYMNYRVSSTFLVYVRKRFVLGDSRNKLMNNIIQGIRVVKFYAWETSYLRKIAILRGPELIAVRQLLWQLSKVQVLVNAGPMLLQLVMFLSYYALISPNDLKVADVFVTIGIMNILRTGFILLPLMISFGRQYHASILRVRDFLLLPEHMNPGHTHVRSNISALPNASVAIELTGVHSHWEVSSAAKAGASANSQGKASSSSKAPTNACATGHSVFRFHDVDVVIKRGSLVMVVGKVGSGKSSFLSLLMNEMMISSGSVMVRGLMCYVPQTAWTLNRTLRKNITFVYPDIDAIYNAVISDCELLPDVAMLPQGDQTEIGERGVNLSGGQKQRIGVARAVYCSDYYNQLPQSFTEEHSDSNDRVDSASIILFDDPLSAVDVHVAVKLFDNIIMGRTAKCTRILVLNQLQYLSQADQILLISDGKVTEVTAGSPELLELERTHAAQVAQTKTMMQTDNSDVPRNFLKRGTSLSSGGTNSLTNSFGNAALDALSQVLPTNSQCCSLEARSLDAKASIEALQKAAESADSGCSDDFQSVPSHQIGTAAEDVVVEIHPKPAPPAPPVSGAPEFEVVTEKMVTLKTYFTYFSYFGGPLWWLFLVFLMVVWQFLVAYSNLWLSYWSSSQERELAGWKSHDIIFDDSNGTPTPVLRLNSAFYPVIYVVQILILTVAVALREWLWVQGVSTSQLHLHLDSLLGLLGAPMRFFDVTMSGSILTRFSKNLFELDYQLPLFMNLFIVMIANMLCGVVVAISVQPWFVIPFVLLLAAIYAVFYWYEACALKFRRAYDIAQGPVLSAVSELLAGIAPVRAFSAQSYFLNEFCSILDVAHVAYFAEKLSFEWTRLRISIAAVSMAAASFFVIAASAREIDEGLAGLAVSQFVFFVLLVQGAVFMKVQSGFAMNAVDRLASLALLEQEDASSEGLLRKPHWADYLKKLVVFVPRILLDESNTPVCHVPSATWMTSGDITLNHLDARYAPSLPLVLKGISLQIKSGENIGIVGRTGSGKSSLFLALLRLIRTEGIVSISGRDTSELNVRDLRAGLCIIPQDPVLFAGTIRSNLDPLETYSDEQIWDAIRNANLYDYVSGLASENLKNPLEYTIEEMGRNVSVGQAQLLCLARAVLRKPRVLLMDEATASVDVNTDGLVQDTIRRVFANVTILTVAHRLHTVLNSDRVLVLSDGKILEFGAPSYLLAQPNSAFRMMAQRVAQGDEEL